MTELEKIESEITRLKRQAISLRQSLPKPHYNLNDIPLLQARANRLKGTTVKKEPKIKKQKSKKIMKRIVKIAKEKLPALIVAAGYADCKVLETGAVNPKEVSALLSVSRDGDLLTIGGYMETLTKEEITAELAKKKAKEEADAKEAKKK